MSNLVPVSNKEYFQGFAAALGLIWQQGYSDTISKQKPIRERGDFLMTLAHNLANINKEKYEKFKLGEEVIMPPNFFAVRGEDV